MALRSLFLPRTQRSRTGLTYAAPMALKNDALAALGLGRALQGAGSTKSAPCNGGTLSG
jgi:hypothetical protein